MSRTLILTLRGLVASSALILSSQLFAAQSDFVIEDITPSMPENAVTPRLTGSGDNIVLSYVVNDQAQQLVMQPYQKNAWQAPQTLATGHDWFINWADFASVIRNGTATVGHVLPRSEKGQYDYNVQLHSNEHSWLANTDGVVAEHGFVSLAWHDQTRFWASWLDGRYSTGNDHHHSAGMSLRAALFALDGTRQFEAELDNLTCDCCQTAIAIAKDGPIMAYRNRTTTEVRDIYVARFSQEKWQEPTPVYNDNWQVAGCPVNGPAILANGDKVAVAWFTGANGDQIKLALSSDGGRNFALVTTIATSNASTQVLGRIALSEFKDSIVVSWLANNLTSNTASYQLNQYDWLGQQLASQSIMPTSASRKSGFATLVTTGDALLLSALNDKLAPTVLKITKVFAAAPK